jgi:hypothetical protein
MNKGTTMRAILYYVEAPRPGELHGLQRLVFENLEKDEAQTLMQVPAVRQPGVPLPPVTFRGREYARHEDNRAIISNHWGITDVYVLERKSLITMLLPREDLAELTGEGVTNA